MTYVTAVTANAIGGIAGRLMPSQPPAYTHVLIADLLFLKPRQLSGATGLAGRRLIDGADA
jgi:hypothetical protein